MLRKRYSEEERLSALRLLKENSYNFIRTSRESGVNYLTLKNWFQKYKQRLSEEDAVSIISERVEINISKMKANFFETHFEKLSSLTSASVDRALQLVKEEKDLSKVNGTLHVLADFFSKIPEDLSNNDNTGDKIHQSVIQINNIIEDMNRKKTNKKADD